MKLSVKEELKWDLSLVQSRYQIKFPIGVRILERSLGKTFKNSLIKGNDSLGGISESKSWTLYIWYKYPLDFILKDFQQEMIRPLGIEFPPSHSKTGSFEKLNFTTFVLQSI